MLITWRNLAFLLISSMVLGLLDQLQIFWQLCPIELLGLLTGTGLLAQAVPLDIYKAFNRVWHAAFLQKLRSYEIWGQILGLISSFPSNRWLLGNRPQTREHFFLLKNITKNSEQAFRLKWKLKIKSGET